MSAPEPQSLPDEPNLDWLRKQAKRRLADLRQSSPGAKLAEAQLDVARRYGFPSWRALKAHIDSLTLDGQLFKAAGDGDVNALVTLLDHHPDRLHARRQPYDFPLLHVAAQQGHLAVVDLLLQRGLDANLRESGDNTYAMHWAAAAGHLDVVRRLADAGGDVTSHGDDHELEVIGWATCWDGCDDDAHRAIAGFLVSRGARHHIFSAIAMRLSDEVRRIVAADPAQLSRRMSRNESHQLPLHFALRMNRPEMVTLLLELGADPSAPDGSGVPPVQYAVSSEVTRGTIEALYRGRELDLVGAMMLGDDATAERLINEGGIIGRSGALHLMAKRGDVRAVKWLLAHGADAKATWDHWGAMVTPLHLAALGGHVGVVQPLLDAGADPTIKDSMHDSDALGWAEFFRRAEIVQLLKEYSETS